jgi:hypothetical protein
MIEFVVDQEGLILKYSSEIRGSDWIWGELKTHGEATHSILFQFLEMGWLGRGANGAACRLRDGRAVATGAH